MPPVPITAMRIPSSWCSGDYGASPRGSGAETLMRLGSGTLPRFPRIALGRPALVSRLGDPGDNAKRLKCRRDHRRRHEVLFDAADAGDVLGRDAQGLLLRRGPIVADPDVHDTVPDDDVGRPGMHPRLLPQFGQQSLTDRAIVRGDIAGQLTSYCR